MNNKIEKQQNNKEKYEDYLNLIIRNNYYPKDPLYIGGLTVPEITFDTL